MLKVGVALGGKPGGFTDTASPLLITRRTQTTTTTSCSTLSLLTAEVASATLGEDSLASASANAENILDMLSAQTWETQIGIRPSQPYKRINSTSAATQLLSLMRNTIALRSSVRIGATGVLRAQGATGTFGNSAASGTTGVTAAHKNGTWSFSKSGLTLVPTVTQPSTTIPKSMPTRGDLPVTNEIASEPPNPIESNISPQTAVATMSSYLSPSPRLSSLTSALSTVPSESITPPKSSSKTLMSLKGVGVKLSSVSGQALSLAITCLFFSLFLINQAIVRYTCIV